MFYRVYNFLSKSCRKRIKFIMVSYWTGKKSMVSQNLCFMFLGCFLITSESHPLKFLLDNKGRMHGYSGSFCNRERLWFMEKRGRNNWKILWYGIRLDRLKHSIDEIMCNFVQISSKMYCFAFKVCVRYFLLF